VSKCDITCTFEQYHRLLQLTSQMSSYQIEELGISYICKLNCEEDSHAHSSIYKSEKL